MKILRELGQKSWATPGVVGEIGEQPVDEAAAAKTGLNFFLAVLTSMFGLFCVGYRLRMGLPDWVPMQDPNLLWFNTALLIFSAVAMQMARNAASRGKIRPVRLHLTIAGTLTIAFLVGQIVVWQNLLEAGLWQLANAPLAFFLLLTGLHALHLAGGLLVWARCTKKAWQGMEVVRFKLSVELCTTYWHYLLAVWFVFFGILWFT